MKRKKDNIEMITRDLLKKSVQQPATEDFNEQLMQKVMQAPIPVAQKTNGKALKKAWYFAWL